MSSVKAGSGSRDAIHTQIVWENCTKLAGDRFSAQPEPAQAVAEAAMAACEVEGAYYILKGGIKYREVGLRETSLPGLMARVMENRASSRRWTTTRRPLSGENGR